MKFYIKETRNEEGEFYRESDWSIEKSEDWDNGKDNFTKLVPPEETLKYNIPCDFISGEWVIDKTSGKYKNFYQVKRRKEYPSIEDQLDYIYHFGLTKWKTDIIKPVKDKYPKP